ncbi:B-cell receptor CD22-like, partial [Silurus meridionalis]
VVNYTSNHICALKGSTVTLGCRYSNTAGYTVQSAFWTRKLLTDKEPPDLSLDSNYSGRVRYLGNKLHNCSLRLSDVRVRDRGKYYFTFNRNQNKEMFQGKDGVELSVTELRVEMNPATVVEGGNVTLTCTTNCSLTDIPSFNWYRNESLLSSISSPSPLHLGSVSQSDTGKYSCAEKGQSYRSPALTITVQYPPKRVSVSISPSGEIVDGSLVTLTCYSDANPPVKTYTWYKVNESSPVGSGQSYSFTLSSSSSGWFYCVAQNKYGSQRAAAM